jgi:hypothetical protein
MCKLHSTAKKRLIATVDQEFKKVDEIPYNHNATLPQTPKTPREKSSNRLVNLKSISPHATQLRE